MEKNTIILGETVIEKRQNSVAEELQAVAQQLRNSAINIIYKYNPLAEFNCFLSLGLNEHTAKSPLDKHICINLLIKT